MRKLIIFTHTGECGADGADAVAVPDDWTEEQIQEMVWEYAKQNAEMYGIYPRYEYEDALIAGDMTQEEFDEMEDAGSLSDNIEGYYEEYDSAIHDMQRSGGGSFEEDF